MTETLVWVDDVRPAPEGWVWCKTLKSALDFLSHARDSGTEIDQLSLDHDLGGDKTARPIVIWMCDTGFWPKVIHVHSQNPIGRDWLVGTIDRYMP